MIKHYPSRLGRVRTAALLITGFMLRRCRKVQMLLLLALLLSSVCMAQNKPEADKDYIAFDRSFRQNIDYPMALFKSCTATVCLLKIQLNTNKDLISMALSDSADSLLKKEFEQHKQQIDTKLLVHYLKTTYAGSNCDTYLIPLSYSFHQMPCPPPTINVAALTNYFKFNGKGLGNAVIFLNPINSVEHIQH